MAVITELKMRGKKLVEVFLDEKSIGRISVDAVVANGMKTGCEIDYNKLKKIQYDSTLILAKEKALNLVSRAPQTEYEVKNKLLKAGYELEVCEACINLLKEYRYLNDENYARLYIETKKERIGKNKLALELSKRGISKEIINDTLADLESDREEIYNLLKKFMSNKEKNIKNKTKAYRFLYSRGFINEDCSYCINKYFGEDDDWG